MLKSKMCIGFAIMAFFCFAIMTLSFTNTVEAQENNTIKLQLEESLTLASPSEQQKMEEEMMKEKIMSPRQQMKSGVDAKDVVCREGLELIIKATDGSAACVKPTSVSVLIERGWAAQ